MNWRWNLKIHSRWSLQLCPADSSLNNRRSPFENSATSSTRSAGKGTLRFGTLTNSVPGNGPRRGDSPVPPLTCCASLWSDRPNGSVQLVNCELASRHSPSRNADEFRRHHHSAPVRGFASAMPSRRRRGLESGRPAGRRSSRATPAAGRGARRPARSWCGRGCAPAP